MYKVFVHNVPIFFRESKRFDTNLPQHFFPTLLLKDWEQFQLKIKEVHEKEDIYIDFVAIEKQFSEFWKNFNFIEAAGGIVENPRLKRSLFIFRNGCWDIPKGKIEENETPEITAIREITEECGINELKILHPLIITYHAYFAYQKYWIKKTFWFVLETVQTDVKPQFEEGIIEVKWVKRSDFQTIRNNTFDSILEVMDFYEKLN